MGETIYKLKCKIYALDEKQWKLRGIGDVKLNTFSIKEKTEKSDKKIRARILCRDHSTLKTVINAMIRENTKFVKQNEKNVIFTVNDCETKSFLLRLDKEENDAKIDTFFEKINQIKDEM